MMDNSEHHHPHTSRLAPTPAAPDAHSLPAERQQDRHRAETTDTKENDTNKPPPQSSQSNQTKPSKRQKTATVDRFGDTIMTMENSGSSSRDWNR